ncbi:hypothetical protein ACFQU3_23565 [Terrabacter sp. GCM10028922]|uniref:hypothetical protein n=1 Tax=Terrabacter sp. GCM10028922 TaxID=3273428 RepID=UPI00360A5C14
MTNQPGFPVAPGAGLAAAAMSSADDADQTAGRSTDQGVPVGAEDVRADEERARGDDDTEDALDEGSGAAAWPDHGDEDDGVPVGAADAEEDRRRASEEAEPG